LGLSVTGGRRGFVSSENSNPKASELFFAVQELEPKQASLPVHVIFNINSSFQPSK